MVKGSANKAANLIYLYTILYAYTIPGTGIQAIVYLTHNTPQAQHAIFLFVTYKTESQRWYSYQSLVSKGRVRRVAPQIVALFLRIQRQNTSCGENADQPTAAGGITAVTTIHLRHTSAAAAYTD